MYDILRLFSTGRSHIALLIRTKRYLTEDSKISDSTEVLNPEELVLMEESKVRQ